MIKNQTKEIISFFKNKSWSISEKRINKEDIIICSKENVNLNIIILSNQKKFVPLVEVEMWNKKIHINKECILWQHNSIESMYRWISDTIKRLSIKLKTTRILSLEETLEKWYDQIMGQDQVPSWWPGHKMIF